MNTRLAEVLRKLRYPNGSEMPDETIPDDELLPTAVAELALSIDY